VISSIDQQLISSLRQGDTLALEKLFHQYHAELCSIAHRLLDDREKSKDVVQEVFIKLWKNRASLEITYSIKAYLRKAVVNTTLNVIEQTKKTGHMALDEKIDFTDERTASSGHDLGELESRVQEAIAQLPARTRAVFTLIRMEEMSYREVASALTISEKAVEKEMMKALRILRSALRDYLPLLIVAFLFS
jgi:RNA polymerase sigma-70 factor (family 1)